ncbi:MAG: DUF3810 domain-containing protein [Chitinophagaceae bacterium]
MLDEQRVELWYASGVYPFIAAGMRYLLGWLPISFGDLLYVAAILYVIITLRKSFQRPLLTTARRLFIVLSLTWLVFHFLWGFNYYRTSIPEQFKLERDEVNKEEIIAFAEYTLREANKLGIREQGIGIIDKNLITSAYEKLSKLHPQLTYHPSSFKSSLFGVLGNYMGYGGYYNPFTGEAQINDHMPSFMLPYIAVHEVAHQLGYAKESEANFIGYLAAMHSGDSVLQYSANLEMFLYANRALRRFDSTLAKQNMVRLSPRVKKDLADYKVFAEKYYGPVDKFVTWFYTGFLNFNNQPEGMMSYNRGMLYTMRYLKKQTLNYRHS